jgi:acyl carrier protein
MIEHDHVRFASEDPAQSQEEFAGKICWTRTSLAQQHVNMTMNNSVTDVKEKVRAFVLEYAAGRITEVKDDENLLQTNIIDSLGSFRMIAFLEETFPLTIEDMDMLPENFQTLNAVEKFIIGKIGTANGEVVHAAPEPVAATI